MISYLLSDCRLLSQVRWKICLRSLNVLKPSLSERLVGERTNAMTQFSNYYSSNNVVSLTANEKLLESLSGRDTDPEGSSVMNRGLARNSRDWLKLMRRIKYIEHHMVNKV